MEGSVQQIKNKIDFIIIIKMIEIILISLFTFAVGSICFNKEIKIKYYNNKIKRLIFRKKLNNYKSEDECIICFDDFNGTKKCRQLHCGHIYHNNCIYNWLKERPTCPLCNKNLINKYGKDAIEEIKKLF
jgi:hypothetical protein